MIFPPNSPGRFVIRPQTLVCPGAESSQRILKGIFSAELEWFAKVDSKLACDFLERWPSLEELQAVSAGEVKKFFRHRRGRQGELTEWRMQGISQAMPAIRDRAVIEAKQTVVQVIAQLIRTLLEGIATLDRKIAEARRPIRIISFFESLPRAGAALVPRLLATLGSQRDRYGSATEVQKYSGIAPVTERYRLGFASCLEAAISAYSTSCENDSEILATLHLDFCGSCDRLVAELPIRYCRDPSPRHFDRAKSIRANRLWRNSCSGHPRSILILRLPHPFSKPFASSRTTASAFSRAAISDLRFSMDSTT